MIKKKKKKNRILITLCAMFLAVASVFAFIPFTKNDTLVVKADSVTTDTLFQGSNINLVISGCANTSTTSMNFSELTSEQYLFFSWKFNIFLSTSNVVSFFYNGVHTSTNYFVSDLNDNIAVDDFNLLGHAPFGQAYNGVETLYVAGSSKISYLGYSYVNIFNDYSRQPSLNLVSVSFGNYKNLQGYDNYERWINSSIQSGYFNYISYLDTAGYLYTYFIPVCYQNYYSNSRSPYYYFDVRTYYYKNGYEGTDTIDYDIGYSDGYNYGYQKGVTESDNNSYTTGYDEGYNIGHNLGYNNGYSDGVESANDYTFLSLLSATIDAPVKYFQSLFNFELLGVNLQGFLTGLFTLCVIVTIIKIVL